MIIEALVIYVALALAAGIKSYFDVLLVVRRKLRAEGKTKHVFVENPVFSAVAWIVWATVFFPFILDSVLRPSSNLHFINAVYKSAVKNG